MFYIKKEVHLYAHASAFVRIVKLLIGPSISLNYCDLHGPHSCQVAQMISKNEIDPIECNSAFQLKMTTYFFVKISKSICIV